MLKYWNNPASGVWKQDESDLTRFIRRAGCNEVGFYHYGRSDPKAPSDVFCRVSVALEPSQTSHFTEAELLYAWTILRSRHPLLDCQFKPSTNTNIEVQYICTDNASRARSSFSFEEKFLDWEETRNHLTNCPRIITDQQLSALNVYKEQNSDRYDLVILCSHAISDGISISVCMNDLLRLLSSEGPLRAHELSIQEVVARLPPAMEAQMPQFRRTPRELWQAAISYVLLSVREERQKLGPRIVNFSGFGQPPETRQHMYQFSQDVTERLISTSRKNGCTVGHLIFAASVAAFTDMVTPTSGSWTSIGTPLSARRLFRSPHDKKVDEVVIALAFLYVVLPCVQITGHGSTDVQRLWTLARMAKREVHGTIENPLFSYQSYAQQEKRMEQAWSHLSPTVPASEAPLSRLSFGSSAIGPLDKYLTIPAGSPVKLLDVAIGMRVRQGECLMHSYSLDGRLRLSLMYDNQLGSAQMQTWIEKTANLMEIVLVESAKI